MTTPFFSLEQMASVYKVEQDWLFEKLLGDKGICELGGYQLGSTSNVARIRISLEKKEIIDTGNRNNVFTGPIFREWFRRHYFEER